MSSSKSSSIWRIVIAAVIATIMIGFPVRRYIFTLSDVKKAENAVQKELVLQGKGSEKIRVILSRGVRTFHLTVTEDPGYPLKLEILENSGESFLGGGTIFEARRPNFQGIDSVNLVGTDRYLLKLKTKGEWTLRIK